MKRNFPVAIPALAAALALSASLIPQAAAQDWAEPNQASSNLPGSSDEQVGESSQQQGESSDGLAGNSDASSVGSSGSSVISDTLTAPRGSAQMGAWGSGRGSSDASWLSGLVGSSQAGSSIFDGFRDGSSQMGSSGSSGSSEGSSTTEGGYAAAKEILAVDDRGQDTGVDHGPEPKLLDIRQVDGNLHEIDVWSPANQTVVTNLWLKPATEDAVPGLILMSGADGGAGGANWATETDYESFFADKPVNVVTPIGGGSTMYANWTNDDAVIGKAQWETYLAKELPAVINSELGGNGQLAIAGLSMSGGPSLHIAGTYPDTFAAAASFSGFPASSGILGRIVVNQVVNGKGGSSLNAFGLSSSDEWQLRDPSYDPGLLAGKKVFVGTAAGIPTAAEVRGNWTWGLTMEVVSQMTSNYFARAATEAGADVHRFNTIYGAHTYALFERQLHAAWESTLGPALGVD